MEGASDPSGGEVLAEISDGLVALHRRYYGKGPTAAKTYEIDDTIVCILRDGFTTVERSEEHTSDSSHIQKSRGA